MTVDPQEITKTIDSLHMAVKAHNDATAQKNQILSYMYVIQKLTDLNHKLNDWLVASVKEVMDSIEMEKTREAYDERILDLCNLEIGRLVKEEDSDGK